MVLTCDSKLDGFDSCPNLKCVSWMYLYKRRQALLQGKPRSTELFKQLMLPIMEMNNILEEDCSAAHADVVVIGGGLSGLNTAKRLHDKGLKVLVLEARDRLGGRTHTIQVKPRKQKDETATVDLGGSYVGSTQFRVLKLVEEFGLRTYPTNEIEDLVYFEKNNWKRFTSVFPPAGDLMSWLDVNHVIRLVEDMTAQVPIDKPWTAPKAKEWDRITFQQFIEQTAWTKAGKFVLEDTVRLNNAVNPHEVSLLFILWFLKKAGGIHCINATEGGCQEMKIKGGTQQLSTLLAEKIGRKNVLLNQPVVQIDQTGEDVVVTALGGATFKCKHVVVTTPIAIQSQITFSPELPAARTQLIQRVPMGCVMKVFLYYDTPFWKENGFCGSANINDEDCLVNYTMDNSNEDGSIPALVAFIVAQNARRAQQLTREERKTHVTQVIADVFQSDKALLPIHYEEKDWTTEQYSGGCYCLSMPPGVLTAYGEVLREPVDRVYFAGTETATEYMGYMEGALQSGERAARQVLEAQGLFTREDYLEERRQSEIRRLPRIQQGFFARHAPSVPAMGTVLVMTAMAVVGVASMWSQQVTKICDHVGNI